MLLVVRPRLPLRPDVALGKAGGGAVEVVWGGGLELLVDLGDEFAGSGGGHQQERLEALVLKVHPHDGALHEARGVVGWPQ